MDKKKRPPREQLIEAGKIARQMLIDKGFLRKESVIDELMATEGAPTLPGIPAYLPHEWTIKTSQRIMRDLLVLWRIECKKRNKYVDDITEFFKFVVKEMRQQERAFNKDVVNMPKLIRDMKEVPVLKDVFSPMRKKENIKAIQRFFIDSFAVSIALKHAQSTSEYANWFIDWTQDLYELWIKPDDRQNLKRV